MVTIRRWITENTTLLSLLMIALGVIFIFISKELSQGVVRDILESFGVLFTSIFFISLLYEKFLAEKHFSQFKKVMGDQLLAMDNLQSICTRLGIREIFETRNDYEKKYPLLELLSRVKTNGKILVAARTLFHFLNKEEAIKRALEKGAHLQMTCLTPTCINTALADLSFIKVSDIKTPLEVLLDLLPWIEEHKPSGTIELRTYEQPLPDSLLYVETDDKNIVAWDMTFGRDLIHKKVFLLEPASTNLGTDLLNRYMKLFNSGKECLKVDPSGNVVLNNIPKLIKECG